MKQTESQAVQHAGSGTQEISKRLFHFGWRVGQGWRPSVQELRDTYQCSRATAYRLQALVREVATQSFQQRMG